MSAAARHVRVAIVGGGFGGLGAAIALRRAGIGDFVLLERAGDVGGTWRDNSYPRCACRVAPSGDTAWSSTATRDRAR